MRALAAAALCPLLGAAWFGCSHATPPPMVPDPPEPIVLTDAAAPSASAAPTPPPTPLPEPPKPSYEGMIR